MNCNPSCNDNYTLYNYYTGHAHYIQDCGHAYRYITYRIVAALVPNSATELNIFNPFLSLNSLRAMHSSTCTTHKD